MSCCSWQLQWQLPLNMGKALGLRLALTIWSEWVDVNHRLVIVVSAGHSLWQLSCGWKQSHFVETRWWRCGAVDATLFQYGLRCQRVVEKPQGSHFLVRRTVISGRRQKVCVIIAPFPLVPHGTQTGRELQWNFAAGRRVEIGRAVKRGVSVACRFHHSYRWKLNEYDVDN